MRAPALCVGLCLGLALAPAPVQAVPLAYDLQRDASTVAFATDFGGQTITGDIPLDAADLVIDFDRLSNCKIAVRLNAARADASFPFAAQALKGPTVLDTAAHPQMTFVSTSVSPKGKGARVKGNLSLEGIVTFQLRVLEKLGVEGPYHLAGASVGAIFAQYFAIRFPTRTRSLALLGGSYRFANRKGQIDRLEQVIAEDFEAIQAGSGSVRAAAEREHITRFLLRCESMDPQTGLRYLDLFSKEPELAPRLGEITAPTLIVQGRCDSVVGVKTGHFLHGAIPNSSYLELPESGHFVCVTDTDAVNQALAEHLRRNGSQS